MTFTGNMKNWTRLRDYYCCISLFLSCYINISSLMTGAANCDRISCLWFKKTPNFNICKCPPFPHSHFIALDQPDLSCKWSIHSLPGFLVPFCQLRMSDTLLGCSVSALPGLYQEAIPRAVVKCYLKDIFRTILLCPWGHRHQCLGHAIIPPAVKQWLF